MAECDNTTGHELVYKEMFGVIDDPVRVKQRADCIHCQKRFWVVYERSHIEDCGPDERGYNLDIVESKMKMYSV